MKEVLGFHDCCKRISDNAGQKALNWAVNYARAGLYMAEGSEEARVQALYIVGNITHWRGEEAKLVRASLKVHGK